VTSVSRPDPWRPVAGRSWALLAVVMIGGIARVPCQTVPAELAGFPVIELTRAARPDGTVWVGTYGHGLLVHPAGASGWRQIRSDTTAQALSWDFVGSIAFGAKGEVWVGTIGNGWGLSRDDGATWRNWTFSELGPEWQYVARDGIAIRGDTVAIATADGLQVTTDDGAHWLALTDAVGPPARGPADTALAVLPSEYLTALRTTPATWEVHHLRGWSALDLAACFGQASGSGQRPCLVGTRGQSFDSLPVGLVPAAGPSATSAKGWSPWFARPIAAGDQQQIDQTYRWGSTMGGNFQPHQGVEFNNPDGTAVHAIGAGTVVYAGPAEQGALTVAIRHDTMLTAAGRHFFVFSTYYHNSALLVSVGQRVRRGEVISRVGHTGRATNDHLHLEVHASPVDSVPAIVDPLNRYPAYATNPELWIAPLPGTGVIAGTVVNAAGAAVPQARIYGIRKPEPRETPFAFVETYGPRNHPSPMYGEHFAISDVPAGRQTLFVNIDGHRVERTVTVRAGEMTWVEFRP
jgi:hypothetical protein